jgi:TolA-binding protein
LSSNSSTAAAAALLVLSACATGTGQVQPEVASLRAEVRTLQRENADLARRVDSMATQIDLLVARSARPAPAEPAAVRPASPSPALAVNEDVLVVPSHLKVIRLEPTRASSPAPAIPTATPIQEPSAEAIASLTLGGKPSPAGAKDALERARAQPGLQGARALEQFADANPSSANAGEALVDAARRRLDAGDPDGSCEDFSRAVAEYPASRSMPDALEGLSACELRRGRPTEASRLQSRLAKDFPDSPAGKRAREHAPAVQGAAP